jgi:simple sugar transport system substrate-binding protein
MMSLFRPTALAVGIALAIPTAALAQQGVLSKAVGGYTFDDAAKEGPNTKNFNSRDGKLTFAIVTHTAGNGFFDPTYVGAKVAADAFGINLVMLGSEAPVDDIPRQIEIINQIVQDPTIDGVIMTTPQSGAYDDIVKKLTERNGIPIATTNSFDGKLLNRSAISHTGQDASAAAIGGEALVQCLIKNGVKGGSIIFPNTTTLGQRRGQQPHQGRLRGDGEVAQRRRPPARLQVDAGPQNIGIDVDANNVVASIARCSRAGATSSAPSPQQRLRRPHSATRSPSSASTGKVCAFGFDLGPKQQEQIRSGALTGSLGQQPFLQGFWPVMQLYLQIDRGISAANLDTRAQLVTKETVDRIGKRFEN